jgi:hypothetical protein
MRDADVAQPETRRLSLAESDTQQPRPDKGDTMELTNIRCDRSRSDLYTLLEHVRQNIDQFTTENVVRLAGAFERMASTDGIVNIDGLGEADADELWACVNGIAKDNGVVWELEPTGRQPK